MKQQNIVLIGFRGAGKTLFGKALAKAAGLPFADLDQEVEFVLGESIFSFVEKHGWQVFREMEQRVAHDFSRNFSGVIATGGGTIENSKNLQNLKKTGYFVFLNPDFSEVKKFLLKTDPDRVRPRINPDVPLAVEIDQLWQQRKGIYGATADIEANPDYHGKPLEEAKKILSLIPERILPNQPKQKRVAIFSSSNGTTFQGLLDAQDRGRIPNVVFDLFLTDKSDCKALEKAKKAKVSNIEVVEPQDGQSKEDYDRVLMNILREHQPDVTLLAGWMRILSSLYCEQFGQTTLNVHPSLLPKFAGLKAEEVHAQVLEYEERYTGCSIHRVTAEVDAGENVLQRKIPVETDDTVDTLRDKVQKQEILGFCEVLERK